MNDIIKRTDAVNFIQSLGVPKPSARFLLLFYIADGANLVPRFNTVQMAEIFEKGNYTQLAKEYFEAKQAGDTKKCEELFQKAITFIPAQSPS